MESCDALLAAIDAFEGTVVMVTHNEMFLHALAGRLVVFKGGKTDVFEGTYQEFLDKVGWDEGESLTGSRQKAPEKQSGAQSMTKKEYRRMRSLIVAEKGRALKPLEKNIEALENAIIGWEEKLEDLNLQMQEAAGSGRGEDIEELSRQMHEYREKIDEAFGRLEKLSEDAGSLKSGFDARLAELDGQRSF
jgi:ATP-binding cassette subfamily F protein 3